MNVSSDFDIVINYSLVDLDGIYFFTKNNLDLFGMPQEEW